MTRRAIHTITEEPRDEVYRDLLRVAARFAERALLVVRRSDRDRPDVVQTLRSLRDFVPTVSEVAEWPGTQFLDDTAFVDSYAVEPRFIAAVGELVWGLYDWQHPERPEDLCFMRRNGEPWLATIAHEHDSYLILEESEAETLRREIPALSFVRDGRHAG